MNKDEKCDLKAWQLKELLQDVEDQNIERANVNGLIIWNSNPKMYGEPGSNTRKAFQYKWVNWKVISTRSYMQLLSKYEVDPSQRTSASFRSMHYAKNQDDEDAEDSDKETEETEKESSNGSEGYDLEKEKEENKWEENVSMLNDSKDSTSITRSFLFFFFLILREEVESAMTQLKIKPYTVFPKIFPCSFLSHFNATSP